LHNSRTHIRERKGSQRNEFRRKGVYFPFRGIHIAVKAFSPKMGPKIVQSRGYHQEPKSSCLNLAKHLLVHPSWQQVAKRFIDYSHENLSKEPNVINQHLKSPGDTVRERLCHISDWIKAGLMN
jgi:hypothetical protein